MVYKWIFMKVSEKWSKFTLLAILMALLTVPAVLAEVFPMIDPPDAIPAVPPYNGTEAMGLEFDPSQLEPVYWSGKTFNAETLEASIIPPNRVPAGSFNMESIIAPDGRVKVSDTTQYPFSTVVKIYAFWSDGSAYMGTGSIVGSPDGHGYHVLTAGHMVYDPDMGWCSAVQVIPAMYENIAPYWVALATEIVTTNGWVRDTSPEHDWALVTLDRNVGDFTGWMGVASFDKTDPVYTGQLHTAGYPGDLEDGYSQYYDGDVGAGATNNNHFYWMDTYGGQSGSPVWYRDADLDEYILTVHAYGSEAGYPNFGTRINAVKLPQLAAWLASDTAPDDYANLLDVAPSLSGFTPCDVEAGVTTLELWQGVGNLGTNNSDVFTVSYYLSTDTTITTDDYLVGTVTVDNVTPFNYNNLTWSGTVPGSVPDNEYYVGWIIDSSDDVPELVDNGEANNVGIEESGKLTVTSSSTGVSVSIRSKTTLGDELIGVPVKYDGAWYNTPFDLTMEPGRKRFQAYESFRSGDNWYCFRYWEDGDGRMLTNRSRLKLNIQEDTNLTAVYSLPIAHIEALLDNGTAVDGVEFKVDGVLYGSPVDLEVNASVHYAVAPGRIQFGGVRYTFLNWVDELGTVLRDRRVLRIRIRTDRGFYAVYQ